MKRSIAGLALAGTFLAGCTTFDPNTTAVVQQTCGHYGWETERCLQAKLVVLEQKRQQYRRLGNALSASGYVLMTGAGSADKTVTVLPAPKF